MYIDPNSGGILFQTLALLFGVLSGVILFSASRIKMAFARLARRLRERSQPKSEEEDSLTKSEANAGE